MEDGLLNLMSYLVNWSQRQRSPKEVPHWKLESSEGLLCPKKVNLFLAGSSLETLALISPSLVDVSKIKDRTVEIATIVKFALCRSKVFILLLKCWRVPIASMVSKFIQAKQGQLHFFAEFPIISWCISSLAFVNFMEIVVHVIQTCLHYTSYE